MRTLLPLATTLLISCGTMPTPTLQLADYSSACGVDADCVAVYIGPLCQVCGGCSNAAINVADQAKRDADAASASRSCPPQTGPRPVCAACREPAATCDAGVCALKPIN